VCVDARERIEERMVRGSILPREQRRTAEGAESSSGRGHCSRGQSAPADRLAQVRAARHGNTCAGDAGLDLRGALPGGAVGRDLVQGVGRHGDGWRLVGRSFVVGWSEEKSHIKSQFKCGLGLA
jgi:hypothetical protein